ncbi:MAG: tRNA threonylcarbamoyladenosine biosynthesis protein TsaE [Verrucomicrobia bacterium]|jgi:tRNA threonylcarbamoyladenosine biosynthesis protein TsaE|nr:MAG: tRNA threonylcarbamoyladenosine biosynthesis protein TsaE [Verrucomicrobiota bacterium]
MRRVIESIREMNDLGREIASALGGGDVLALCGDLGAGKTHLCKAIVSGLGSPDIVTSPTFTLLHEYRSGRLPVSHFDFYRAEGAGEILALGWDEYLDRGDVLLVEWADKFPELFPAHTRWFRLEVDGAERRLVTMEASQ